MQTPDCATSNNVKLVQWPLMGGLLHLVQRGGDWAGPQLAQTPPHCTKCNSPPINGPEAVPGGGAAEGSAPSEISPPCGHPKKFKIGRHFPTFSAKVIGKQRFHVL